MHIGHDIMDWLFPARKPLRKAAGEVKPPANPPNQNTDYIKAAAEEAVRREAERKTQVKKLTQPSGKEALKVLGTK